MLVENRKGERVDSAGKEILTIDAVAEMTGLSKSYIYVLTHSKRIPHYKPNGGKVYFEKGEITAWLLTNRITPVEEIRKEAQKYCLNNK